MRDDLTQQAVNARDQMGPAIDTLLTYFRSAEGESHRLLHLHISCAWLTVQSSRVAWGFSGTDVCEGSRRHEE